MEELSKGTLLHGGTYRIEKVLGLGSFGITYLATHTLLEKKVAIKEFFMKGLNNRGEDGSITGMTDGSLSYNYGQKFKKEALNLAHLEHPNIVKVTDSFEDNGTFYYVMEYIDGTNLNEYIKQHTISEQEGVSIIRSVAEALIYMHEEKKMLHLDLKPGNIMHRNDDGKIILIDFGLSKHYSSDGQPETSTSIGLGTQGYAPTEQGDNTKQGEFRPTIDVYALGATLLKLVTGETPPSASTLVSDDEILPELLKEKGISDDLSSVIINAMLPNVRKRIQTIRAFVEALPKDVIPTSTDPEELTDVISEPTGKTSNELTDVIEKKDDANEKTVAINEPAKEVQKPVCDFKEEEYVLREAYIYDVYDTAERAQKGNVDCMFAIGIMCLRGEEFVQDSDKAYQWFMRAKNAGDQRAEIVISQWYQLKDRYKKRSPNTPKPGTDDDNESTESGKSGVGILMGILVFVSCLIGIYCYQQEKQEKERIESSIMNCRDFYIDENDENAIYCNIDGERYYVDNIPDGSRTLHYQVSDSQNRKFYTGLFKSNKRIDGTLVWNNGDKFEGTFQNGEMEKGIYRCWSDGSYFVGSFRNNAPYDGNWYNKNSQYLQTITNGQ